MTTAKKKVIARCADCGEEFSMLSNTYNKHLLHNITHRCPDCRNKKRRELQDNLSKEDKKKIRVTCVDCGKEIEIPLTTYHNHKRSGILHRCKDCISIRKRRSAEELFQGDPKKNLLKKLSKNIYKDYTKDISKDHNKDIYENYDKHKKDYVISILSSYEKSIIKYTIGNDD